MALILTTIFMASQEPSVRPSKRKRSARKLGPMTEDDDSALDTVMFEERKVGGSQQKVLIPVRLDKVQEEGGQPTSGSGPDPDPDCNME